MDTKIICFLYMTPLTLRDYRRFGFDIFKEMGFRVYCIDLSNILNPGFNAVYQPPDLLDFQDAVTFRTTREFIDFLSNNRQMFVIDLTAGAMDTPFIYRAFKRFNIKYASCTLNSMVVFNYPPKRLSLLIVHFARRIGKGIVFLLQNPRALEDYKGEFAAIIGASFRHYYRNAIYRLPTAISGLQPPRFIIADGYRHVNVLPKPGRNTSTIWAHALDYDLYLAEKEAVGASGDYVVFLDQYFPYVSDIATFVGKVVKNMDADGYYDGLRRFFDWFELRYKIPVIIAAHPRAHYDPTYKFFGKRMVETTKTASLVSRAKCVFTHNSTAINFAVIYRKPIIFLTSDQIGKTYHGPVIANLASFFNRTPINLDDAEGYTLRDVDFTVHEERYSRYLRDYIKTPGSPQKPCWQIVSERIVSFLTP